MRRSVVLLLLCAAMTIASSAQTLTTLVNFDGTSGADPYSPLIQGTDGNFYGTTTLGGAYTDGEVFRMTAAGTLTTFGFDFLDGYFPPAGVVQATDGNFYGTTSFGGDDGNGNCYVGCGTVFKMTAAGALSALHFFEFTDDGAYPEAGLMQGTNGDLYGTTSAGGGFGDGTVFKITLGGTLTTLHNFDGADGSGPQAGLVQAADGNFYGTTRYGGKSLNCNDGCGTVFKITPDGTLTTLHNFDGADGSAPQAGLLQASDGNFYGTASAGGADGDGTVFKITPSGSLTTLHNFDGADGSAPSSALVQATDGSFYGTASYGGIVSQGFPYGCGTVFKMTAAGTLTTLHMFDGTDGARPVAGLLQATNGIFYGTTAVGDTSDNCNFVGPGCGTVFSLDAGLPLSYTLTVSATGSGSVVSGDIDCGSVCSHLYKQGTQVKLTAIPGEGSTLNSWAGCDTMQGDLCTVTMSGARNVTATFMSVLVTLTSLTLKPDSVKGGQTSVATLTLGGAAAPPGGLGVGISSDNPRVAHPPSLIVVPGGATSTQFAVRTSPAQKTVVKIAASDNTSQTSATLTVNPR